MNQVEQQIHDAAPDPGRARFPVDIQAELESLRNGPQGFDTLLAANPGFRKRRGLAGILAAVVFLGAAAVWLLAAPGQGTDVRFSAVPDPPEASLQPPSRDDPMNDWREVLVHPLWQDPAGPLSASFQIPTRWKVRRHAGSPDYPGLHVSVDDDAGITVAVLYLGQVPGPSQTEHCSDGVTSGGWHEIESITADTGAEALSPGLRGRFVLLASSTGPFAVRWGLVPWEPAAGWCPDALRVGSAGGSLVLAFSTAVTLPGAVQGKPQSSYARSFASWEETVQYRRSAEYETVKRMILSLRIGPLTDGS